MQGGTAIGVDDDLAAGQPAIAVRPADHEIAGRIDVEFLIRRHPALRQHRLHHRAQHVLDLRRRHAVLVLGGDHHGGRCHRLAVDVFQRHLALGVGQQAAHLAVASAAQFRNAPQHQMRVIDCRRHQRLGFCAGIAEHDALVAGALVLVAGGVDAGGDVGGLRVQVNIHRGGLAPGEAFLVVADILDRLPSQFLEVLLGDALRAARLAGQHDTVGGHQRLAGDAGIRVGGEIGIHHGVGNPVCDLVGMAFRHGFGGEEELALIAHQSNPF